MHLHRQFAPDPVATAPFNMGKSPPVVPRGRIYSHREQHQPMADVAVHDTEQKGKGDLGSDSQSQNKT